MKKIFSILFSAVILLGSCNETKEEKKVKSKEEPVSVNTETGFTIEAPPGWEKSDTIYNGKKVVFIRHPRQHESDIFMENVNVTTEKVGNSVSTDYYLEVNKSNLASQLSQFEQGPVSEVTINGSLFKKIEYSHNYSGFRMAGESYLFVKGGTAYVLTCSALEDEIGIYKDVFKEITGTFRFTSAN